jgi:hypothetical protein
VGVLACDNCFILRLNDPPRLPWAMVAVAVVLCMALAIVVALVALRRADRSSRGLWIAASGFVMISVAVVPLVRNNTFDLSSTFTAPTGVSYTESSYVDCGKPLYVPWNDGAYDSAAGSVGREAAQSACRETSSRAGRWSLAIGGIGLILIAAGALDSRRRRSGQEAVLLAGSHEPATA